MAFIDYVGLIKPEGFNDDFEKVEALHERLREISKQFDISIITVNADWVQNRLPDTHELPDPDFDTHPLRFPCVPDKDVKK